MQAAALASGSSGNCFFIGSGKTSFLVDAGISSKQICLRLNSLNKDPSELKGIFISHEHSDHIKGVDVLSRKHSIPIYLTKECYDSCFITKGKDLINFIKKKSSLKINGIKINSFSKYHDAAEPISFSVTAKNKKVSVMTDIGCCCKNVISNLKTSNMVFLESNYDIDMLENGPYPYFLKKRIASDYGHLSNYTAALLILEHASSKLKNVVLSHLSENNNTEELALKTMKGLVYTRKDLKNLKISVSGRNKATELISI
ncbi:MAG: MBL fold metallo-hydrolase [Nanoarchaeota archaeon]